MKTNKKSGFTSIELIVSLIILAIIVTIISALGFGGYEIVHHMH
ncbi:MAG: prepilin-type N-terminal cleavage/methylation domain-containing protein [Candidatus Omnitrophica bacterium]|jgi:prepilin-type N-terminal cleavage/methylation domain-containing protein|nr:prepilin-type N-terminal cleavage/methylation domain-containing protein [Candidatus Omnitrophota bacterium]